MPARRRGQWHAGGPLPRIGQPDQKQMRHRTRRADRVRLRHITLIHSPDISSLRNPLAFPVDVIHQDIFAQAAGSCVKRPSPANAGHLLDEMDQRIVIRQHEGIDGNLAAATTLRCEIGLFQDGGVQTPCMNEQPTVDACRRRAAVRDHDNLLVCAAFPRQ